jgi:hypothetical protein
MRVARMYPGHCSSTGKECRKKKPHFASPLRRFLSDTDFQCKIPVPMKQYQLPPPVFPISSSQAHYSQPDSPPHVPQCSSSPLSLSSSTLASPSSLCPFLVSHAHGIRVSREQVIMDRRTLHLHAVHEHEMTTLKNWRLEENSKSKLSK